MTLISFLLHLQINKSGWKQIIMNRKMCLPLKMSNCSFSQLTRCNYDLSKRGYFNLTRCKKHLDGTAECLMTFLKTFDSLVYSLPVFQRGQRSAPQTHKHRGELQPMSACQVLVIQNMDFQLTYLTFQPFFLTLLLL